MTMVEISSEPVFLTRTARRYCRSRPCAGSGEHVQNLIQPAAQLVLGPLKNDPPSGLVIDLSKVKFVGSVFLSILLHFYTPMKKLGSDMVLAGVDDRIRELLRQTNLDTLWAIYQRTRGHGRPRAVQINREW